MPPNKKPRWGRLWRGCPHLFLFWDGRVPIRSVKNRNHTTTCFQYAKRLPTAQTIGGLVRNSAPELAIEFHAHNDLGLAAGNAIAALAAGAEAVSVTVNGLGERAGNAALEEVVMAARLTLNRGCGIDTRQLVALSELVACPSHRPLRDEKPVVGACAFRHESGIHCAGLAVDQSTYEPFVPEEVGHAPSVFVIGHHSGSGQLSQEPANRNLHVPREIIPELLAEGRSHALRCKRGLTQEEFSALADSFCAVIP